MQVRAMLIAGCLMATAAAGSAMASDSPAPSANSAVTRRRAVDPPRPPSHILLDVSADDDLRYTNHNLHPTPIKTCIERTTLCVSDTLAPGATTTRARLVRTLGQDHADLEIYATGYVEIRGHFDALPLTLATSNRQFLPIMSTGQTLKIYALAPDTFDIHSLGSNGVRENSARVSVHTGVNSVTLPFPSTLGKQLDLNPNTPIIAVSNDGHRVKSLFEAIGEQYVVKAGPGTTAWIKNVDPTAVLAVDSIFYQRNTNELPSTYILNSNVINYGTWFLRDATNGGTGSLFLLGVWKSEERRHTPFLAWAPGLQTDGASANNSFGPSGKKYNVSLNQIPEVVTLFNASSPEGVVNGTITGYDDSGAQTGALTYELPTHGNRDIDVSGLKATRITVSANDAAQSTIPNILLGATINGVEKGGFRVEKPAPPAAIYELRTDLFVVDASGRSLVTTGTTRDTRIMGVMYNVPEIQNALLGTYVIDNNNPEFQVLQKTLDRIRSRFTATDYRSTFDEEKAVLDTFFMDTDGDGLCIDILPDNVDWQYDDHTSAPRNNAQGVQRLQMKLVRLQ